MLLRHPAERFDLEVSRLHADLNTSTSYRRWLYNFCGAPATLWFETSEL
jgi:hypothetical protein